MNSFFRLIDLITAPIRRLFMLLARITPGLKNLPSLSTPMLSAVMSLVVLLIIYAVAVVSYRSSVDLNQQRDWLIWLLLLLLVFVIPVIVYFLVKFWTMKEDSRFPGIDQIWQSALELCQQQGISVRRVPIFLILGAKDQRQAAHLMGATELPIKVSVPKQQDTDLLFFASQDSIFLFLNGCSCLSGLSSQPPSSAAADAMVPAGAAAAGTIDASAFARMTGANPSLPPAAGDVGATLTEGAFEGAFPGPEAQPAGGADVGRTMVLPEGLNMDQFLAGQQKSPDGGAPVLAPTAMLTSQAIFEREQKLRYLCQLINNARSPVCPINGILTLVPFHLVESASGQVQTAAQNDVKVLRDELKMRCSQTVLITHMEREDGFHELIKRVGERESRDSRFGRGADLWNAPTQQRLEAVGVHAVGAFEDWIYLLFQKENALQQRYNSRLLSLLCRVRGRFAENLPAVLGRGFGFDPATEPNLAQEQFLFGGCYFAGTGEDPSKYAFVKSVFAKLLQQEGELEWAPQARISDRQYQWASSLFALLGSLSLLSIVLLLIYKFVWQN
jgi:hypothetical protein